MEQLQEKVHKMVGLMGFDDFRVEVDSTTRRVSIVIRDRTISRENLPIFVLNIDRLIRLIAKRFGDKPIVVDVNNYKKEREALIIKLARAAARKAVATNEEVFLPPMNAYERRLVHTELSVRPDVETESFGENRERHVVVRATSY